MQIGLKHPSLCALALGLILPGTALAQSRADEPTMFVGGLGGVTFGTVAGVAVAGQVGFEVAPNLFVIGEVGRMQDVLPKTVRDELNAEVDALSRDAGFPITVEVAVPVTYGFGGIRWMRTRSVVAPFLEAGVGVGRASIKIAKAEVLGQDFTDELQDELGADSSDTKLLIVLGGGINVLMTERVSLDIGYRYSRIATEDPAINSSMVYVGIKFER